MQSYLHSCYSIVCTSENLILLEYGKQHISFMMYHTDNRCSRIQVVFNSYSRQPQVYVNKKNYLMLIRSLHNHISYMIQDNYSIALSLTGESVLFDPSLLYWNEVMIEIQQYYKILLDLRYILYILQLMKKNIDSCPTIIWCLVAEYLVPSLWFSYLRDKSFL